MELACIRSAAAWLAAAALLGTATAGDAGAQDAAGRSYGFADYEIYELGTGVRALRRGDLDGDGRADLVVLNPGRARIEMLYRLDPDAEDWRDPQAWRGDPNPIEYDGRYRVRHRPEERRVFAIDVGELDGDGRDDLAYATDTGELVVVHPAEGDEPECSWTRRLDALRGGCEELLVADADGDGRAEILLVADGKLLAVDPRDPDAEPRTLDRVEKGLDRLFVGDLDGNGRPDLLLVFHGEDYPFRLRLGLPEGGFGPRTELDLPDVRAALVADVDRDGADEVVCVFQASGRLAVLELGELEADRHHLARFPLEEREGADEEVGFALGDLDGNGVADMVVTDPTAARVTLHLGVAGQRALEGSEFPTLVGVRDPRIGDTNGDGRTELVVVSGSEKMVGLTELADGRLAFPHTMPVSGEPAAMDLADVTGDGIDDVVVFVVTGEGRKREYALHVWAGSKDGLAGEPVTHAIGDVKKVPSAVRVCDLDRDGRADVLAFFSDGRSVPVILWQQEEGGARTFRADERGDDTPGLGILEGADPSAVAIADADGDGATELVACANNFARSLYFGPDRQPVVLEQINGPATDSSIRACVVGDFHPGGAPELALYDARTRELLLFERPSGEAGGPPALVERIEAGRLQLAGLVPADMDGDGALDLVALARQLVGVRYAGARDVTLTEVASHEPKHERIQLHTLASGDLNHDGDPDIVACEVSENAILIVAPEEDGSERSLAHRLGFKVFDQKTFSRGGNSTEPRELIAGDLDGDGKDDLAVLVHDKLIVYVQE